MLQKEVVERMGARPGTKAYGRLSVMLQWRYHIEEVLDVPPRLSSRRRGSNRRSCGCSRCPMPSRVDAALFGELVRVAFSQRRKLLRHTLGRWLEERGHAGSFDVQRRAEEVPVDEYVGLVRRARQRRAGDTCLSATAPPVGGRPPD